MARSIRLDPLSRVLLASTFLLLLIALLQPSSALIFPTGSYGFSSLIYTAEIDPGELEYYDDDDVNGLHDDDDDDDAVTSDALGSAVCELHQNQFPVELTCDVSHSSLTATSVDLGLGKRKQNDGDVANLISSAAGTMPFTFRSTVVIQTVLVDRFLDGEMFLIFRGTQYPQGEMRGQLRRVHKFFAVMNPGSVVPQLDLTDSTLSSGGIFLANYTRHNDPNDVKGLPEKTLSVNVDHDLFGNPTDAAIWEGDVGKRLDTVVINLNSPRSRIRQQVNITTDTERLLYGQSTFIQIASNARPDGESVALLMYPCSEVQILARAFFYKAVVQLRGQIFPIDPIPPITHSARMDHSQTRPPYVPAYGENPRGCAILTINCNSLEIEYLVVHNVEDAITATANAGPRGTAGTFLFDLARPDFFKFDYSLFSVIDNGISAQSPIYGTRTITATQRTQLFSRSMYFEVYKVGLADPVLRGQVENDNDYFAYLSGTQMIPPVTTSAVGCASFDLRPDKVVDYDISHSVDFPSSIKLYTGAVGEPVHPGDFDYVLPSMSIDKYFSKAQSPAHGSDVILRRIHQDAFRRERMFMVVQSADYPNGELRGHVLRLLTASCDFTGGDLPPQQFLPPEIPASQQFGVVTQPSVDVFQNVTGGAAMVVGGVSWALVALVAVLL